MIRDEERERGRMREGRDESLSSIVGGTRRNTYRDGEERRREDFDQRIPGTPAWNFYSDYYGR